MLNKAVTAALLFPLLVLSGGVQAQTKWVMATPYADSNYHTKNNRKFVEDVRKASNGELEITLHTNQSMLKMPDILRGVQTNQVQIGEILLSAYSNEDPFFGVDSIPYVSRGFDVGWKVWQLSKAHIEARLKKRNAVALYSVVWPSQGIYTKQELKQLIDLKGSKFRAYNAATTRFAQLIGAMPTTVQVSELPQAFAAGVVTSMVTSAQTGVDSSVWDFARYYVDAEIMNVKNVVIVNEAALTALSSNLRAIVLKAAADAERRGWDMARAAEIESNATLVRQGINISKPSAAMVAELKAIRDTMLNEWVVKAGDDGVKFARGLE